MMGPARREVEERYPEWLPGPNAPKEREEELCRRILRAAAAVERANEEMDAREAAKDAA
jgi:hypothetical protein